mmetsp:Transcript_42113/g.111195  ORF Transcript_42113/g.111195 Transcript_42113/m.111195 type:complete len:304 (-) Transcript_42113:539-1450(-)
MDCTMREGRRSQKKGSWRDACAVEVGLLRRPKVQASLHEAEARTSVQNLGACSDHKHLRSSGRHPLPSLDEPRVRAHDRCDVGVEVLGGPSGHDVQHRLFVDAVLEKLLGMGDPRGATIVVGRRRLPMVIVRLQAEPLRLHIDALRVLRRVFVQVPHVVCLLPATGHDGTHAVLRAGHDEVPGVDEPLGRQHALGLIEGYAVLEDPAHDVCGCLAAPQDILEEVGEELAALISGVELHREAALADAVQGAYHAGKLHCAEERGAAPLVVHLHHVSQQLRRKVPIHVAALPDDVIPTLAIGNQA